MQEPENTCPKIDEGIKRIIDILYYAKQGQKRMTDDLDAIAGWFSDIEYYAAEIEAILEYCRAKNLELRQWAHDEINTLRINRES